MAACDGKALAHHAGRIVGIVQPRSSSWKGSTAPTQAMAVANFGKHANRLNELPAKGDMTSCPEPSRLAMAKFQ